MVIGIKDLKFAILYILLRNDYFGIHFDLDI